MDDIDRYTLQKKSGPEKTSCDDKYLRFIQNPVQHLLELFCGKSYWLKASNYFRDKAPSQMLDSVLNVPQGPHNIIVTT